MSAREFIFILLLQMAYHARILAKNIQYTHKFNYSLIEVIFFDHNTLVYFRKGRFVPY